MGDNLIVTTFAGGITYLMDGFSSTPLDQFNSGAQTMGAAFHTDGNVYTSLFPGRLVRKHDGFSSTTLDNYSPGTGLRGISIDQNGNMFDSPDLVNMVRRVGFSSTPDVTISIGGTLVGMSWTGTNALTSQITGKVLAERDGFTAIILASFSSAGGQVLDCSWDGFHLYSADDNQNKVYQYDGVSSTVLDEISILGPFGVTWENAAARYGGGGGGAKRRFSNIFNPFNIAA